MKYRTFGKTGEQVSALGFGCMRLPVLEGDNTRIDEELATAMLRRAIDAGVNYVDTAWVYHSTSFSEAGFSETFLGRALSGSYREKVNLATKLPCWLVKIPSDMDDFLDRQLERLQTDRIDYYLLHSMNSGSWEKMKAMGYVDFLDRALASGKIRHAGFSFHDDLSLFKEIVDAYPWSFTQIMYNYYDEHFQAGIEGLRYASEKGLGMVIMEPLRGGALVNGIPDPAKEIFKLKAPGRSHVEWALRWLWKQGEVDVVLSGMSGMEQVEENLELANDVSEAPWTPADEDAVNGVKTIMKSLQRVSCTSCGYCLPCPEGVDIPKNFSFINDYYLLGDLAAKNRYNNTLKAEQKASNCVECGQCEEQCPQQISIREELAQVARVFESGL